MDLYAPTLAALWFSFVCTAVTFSTTLENASFNATNVSGEIKPADEAGSSFDSFDNGAFEIGGSISTSGGPRETSLLVSPLVVAGIVIGLVLVLSCITIIAGSLKKDSRMRGSQLGMMPAQGRDSLSLSGSLGELSLSRTECLAGLEPELCNHSISLSLCMSHVPLNFLDGPPRDRRSLQAVVPSKMSPSFFSDFQDAIDYTHDFDETLPQASYLMSNKALLTALKCALMTGNYGGVFDPPPTPQNKIGICSFLRNDTHAISMKLAHNLHHP
uniref:protein BEAN1 n=1 Tax=Myxine glutinosa TaxID=7769 RepID=UPI00358FDA98